jgi:hypothetical protein
MILSNFIKGLPLMAPPGAIYTSVKPRTGYTKGR